MSSIFRTMSRRSSDSQDTVVNSEEINYPKIQNDLDDWKLLKVSNQEIYLFIFLIGNHTRIS